MAFPHRTFPVYLKALDFVSHAHQCIRDLPKGYSSVSDQLLRASTSIVFNIAEGAGKYSKPDKARFYEIASGSASECSGILDAMLRLGVIGEAANLEGISILIDIDNMLRAMCISLRTSSSRGKGEGEGR